ncbi:uncharacterized protein LOC130788515 [Actinidia eriantha]|uniref:uncharacterized protein LOC130788515 n=1 Tax=Actinidia eriantha TaxID=165200 RepID=UPI002590CCFA|nr:uncharacterized protein LOC130788515 [Actinidia eriantha]
MASTTADDEKWAHSEDEEALSLCDLPLNRDDNNQSREDASAPSAIEDFNFGSWPGFVSAEPEMCVADEVFFRGQIMPFRHSVSSESGLAAFRNPSRSISRSESMDHLWSGRATGTSSRSSSIRSQHSSSSGSSTTTTNPKKVRNPFHAHPSPTPQIRVPSSRYGNSSHPGHQGGRKSTRWSLFRVGLFPAPKIELQDLRARGTNNRFDNRHSCSSTSSSDHQRRKKSNHGLFGGCRCSFDAVETLNLRVPVKDKSHDGTEDEKEKTVTLRALVKDKSNNRTDDEKEKAGTTKKGKQLVSRHRTFEWLRELSIAGVPDEA